VHKKVSCVCCGARTHTHEQTRNSHKRAHTLTNTYTCTHSYKLYAHTHLQWCRVTALLQSTCLRRLRKTCRCLLCARVFVCVCCVCVCVCMCVCACFCVCRMQSITEGALQVQLLVEPPGLCVLWPLCYGLCVMPSVLWPLCYGLCVTPLCYGLPLFERAWRCRPSHQEPTLS